jgi:hypothetical protein
MKSTVPRPFYTSDPSANERTPDILALKDMAVASASSRCRFRRPRVFCRYPLYWAVFPDEVPSSGDWDDVMPAVKDVLAASPDLATDTED